MKKVTWHSEAVYVAALLLLSLAVAMIAAANFGVSMVVAPAYILSLKTALTFGQAEYDVQAVLFVVFCCLMGRVKLVYFTSFLTGVIYGAMLDGWRRIIPHFNPAVTTPGALPMALRVLYFAVGMLLTAFSIALFYRTYLYPQVYDFFVKGISERFHRNRDTFKIGFDTGCLLVSCGMTWVLFHRFVGVGVGTLIMTAGNGLLIGLFGKGIDRLVTVTPRATVFSRRFTL